MTFRLVALMSAVLLLTLAAFGVLINQYQDQVLEGVARTASEVGRATLRTMEFSSDHPAVDTNEVGFVYWEEDSGAGPDGSVDGFGNQWRYSTRELTREIISPDDDAAAKKRADRPRQFRTTQVDVIIDLESIHAESDPARGIVLKIPRLTAAGSGDPRRSVEFTRVSDGQTSSGRMARREEVSLPVPLSEFSTMFAAIRNRSLLIFVGVFIVGAVLTTGLATRFTRPIRKLDAGIRRLSEGDLDVEVAVQGKDEIARLSRAFNEMARKLRENRDRSREMVRREKLTALGRLAAGVAHDVRNPLHSIGLTLEHINETARPERPEQLEDFDQSLSVIRGEIKRLDGLIGNFLSFARSERKARQAVDLAGLVRETVRLVAKEAERRKVELQLELESGVPPIQADGEALRSSLLNLVLNSFEAMPDGGRLQINLSRRDGEAWLSISDTGRGISEEDRERVFEFAYTTRDGGSGLGLAMVHHCVVEEHGGRVMLESNEGQGTTIRLALPAGPASGGAAA